MKDSSGLVHGLKWDFTAVEPLNDFLEKKRQAYCLREAFRG
jgi:hypothetical protein